MRWIVLLIALVLLLSQLTRERPVCNCSPSIDQDEAVTALERVAEMIAQGKTADEIADYLDYELAYHRHKLEVN